MERSQADAEKMLRTLARLGYSDVETAGHYGWTSKQYKERFNEAGTIAREEFGLRFFYHNHDFEFSNKQANGEPLYDILLEETDSRLVKFELDLYWIVYGKEDPNRYLESDPARWPLYHVKDKTWRNRKETQPWEHWEDVGPGSIDFPQIFDSDDGRRLDKLFIIEHDWPQFSHPNDEQAEVKTAAAGAEYLQTVGW